MKLFILIIAISGTSCFTAAQQGTINRLKYKLNTATDDMVKAATLDSIAMYYLFFTDKPDSSFYYINDQVNHAFNLEDKKNLILGYARLGFYYLNTSQYKASLDISFKGINLSEEYDIPDYLSALFYNASWVYNNIGDPSSALNSAFDGLRYLKNNKDPFMDQQLHILGLIGNIYLDSNEYDSAHYYFNKVDSLSYISNELAAKDISNWYQGMYYLFNKNYSRADSIFSTGIRRCEKNGDFLLNVFNLFLAQSYFNQGKINEAISAAKRAMIISESLNDHGDAQGSASLLYDCYNKTGNRDSAFQYLKISDSLRALVLSKGNASQVQQVRFDRQLGLKEKEEQKVLQNEKNRTYVFLTALVFFSYYCWHTMEK
ncbi:MAG: hypothetical protein WDO19_18585 [Bacteroidota bacterium]